MRNADVATELERMARLLTAAGAIRFKIQAFDKAASVVAGLGTPMEDLLKTGGPKALTALPGIGAGIAAKIAEFAATGRIAELEALRKSLPPGLETLMDVPNLGPKTAVLLGTRLKIRDLDGLERALKDGRIAKLPRMGEKAAQKLLKSLAVVRQGRERMPLGRASLLAESIRGALGALPQTREVVSAGSLRRGKETVGDLDFLATPRGPKDAPAILAAFVRQPDVADVSGHGATKASVRLKDGIAADLRVVAPAEFGAALHYFTGSREHNIRIRELGVKRGLRINEYGILRGTRRIGGDREADVFKAVGLPFIPPELREGAGEIEAAARGALPDLLEPGDLKGDLHLHSTWSDGNDSLEAMARAGRALGYAYLAVCDHSRSLRMAGGLSVPDLRRKNREIDRLNRSLGGFRLLKGAEVDILEDGSLDYPDDVLAELDVVVISVHTRFTLDVAAQTARVVRALAHPRVTILAHPTGRLIGRRESYAIDLAAVLKAAKAHGKAVEVNAQPDRLDLADVHVKTALGLGLTLSVDSDAHTAGQLAHARRFGVPTARRGWATAGDVLNALPLPRLLKRLGRA